MFLRQEFGLKALSLSCLGNYSSSKERTKDRKEMTEKEQQQQQEEEQHKKKDGGLYGVGLKVL